jgi:hypothetical protein
VRYHGCSPEEAMRLESGLDIPDPWEKLREMRERWHDAYDAVPVETDSELRVWEITLSVMLNNQTSGNTAFDIWEKRAPIERALRGITDADLIEANNGLSGQDQLSELIDAICSIRWVGLASATKILHKKRPALIPIFDSRVHGYYCRRKYCSIKTGNHFIELTLSFHADLLSVEGELRELHQRFAQIGKPLTHSRILDHLIWIQRAG